MNLDINSILQRLQQQPPSGMAAPVTPVNQQALPPIQQLASQGQAPQGQAVSPTSQDIQGILQAPQNKLVTDWNNLKSGNVSGLMGLDNPNSQLGGLLSILGLL